MSDNEVEASGTRQTESGNGIHLWYSPGARVENNRVRGHRDGIYFEFSSHGLTRGNVSERSQRYGLHFMFSDSCAYLENTFRDNNSGVAVMYSRGVVIARNRFERSWGSAAYGLLLKDINGGEITDNTFERNSTWIFVEGSSRLALRGNTFSQNGWAAKVLADADENAFSGNRFSGNAFDVTTNSRSSNTTFDGNWWDEYSGYDLDRDGVGATAFHPVRLFALVVEQHPGRSEQESHPGRNMITQCIGCQQLEPEITFAKPVHLKERDVLLLCSDGLWSPLDDAQMGTILEAHPLQESLDLMAEQAERNSYPRSENISVIALRFISHNKPASARPAARSASRIQAASEDPVLSAIAQIEEILKEYEQEIGNKTPGSREQGD